MARFRAPWHGRGHGAWGGLRSLIAASLGLVLACFPVTGEWRTLAAEAAHILPAPDLAANANLQEQQDVIGPGDTLEITVFGQPELSGSFEVDRNTGKINLPLLGSTLAAASTRDWSGACLSAAIT